MSLRSVCCFLTFLLANLLLLPSEVHAQQQTGTPYDIYGPDPLLYNGRFYTFFLRQGTIGNPFLTDESFINGAVMLRGVEYTGLDLNYDVYNQQLVLRYSNNLGAKSLITLSDAWLESFTINEKKFKTIIFSDTTKKIFQVIGSGPLYLLDYHSKTMMLDNQMASGNYKFVAAKPLRYLQMGDRLLSYKGNRRFISLFTEGKQASVRKYIREHNIQLRKMPLEQLDGLINFCNTL
jgi:hypothetical protein